MTRTFLFTAILAGVITSCQESTNAETNTETALIESDESEGLREEPTSKKLAAINDETRPSEGAIECLTQQYALVKEGKFTEALGYYSARIRSKVEAQLAENPDITKDWQAATNRTKEDFDVIIQSVRENPNSFVFENGMWRMDQR